MLRSLAGIAVLLLSVLGWAQAKAPAKAPASDPAPESAAAFHPIISRLNLQSDSAVTLDQFNGVVPSQTKCDPDGNVYGGFAAGSGNSITRISTNGSQPITFSLSAVPDPEITSDRLPIISEFAIGTDGSVYLLVLMKHQDSGSNAEPYRAKGMDPNRFEYRIITFTSDGKYHSQFKLDQGLAPNRIAVFSSGDLMLAGLEPVAGGGNHPVPFARVFDSSGRFMKDISMPRDLRSPDGKQDQSASSRGSWAWRNSTRNAQGANDGNVYLLPNAAGAPVYVLSPGGEIVRTIKLESAANERLGMSVAAGRLISWSQHVDNRRIQRVASPPPSGQAALPPAAGSNDSLFRIFNMQSGELAAEYGASADLGNFACYNSGSFTFLRLDQAHHLQVVTASPH